MLVIDDDTIVRGALVRTIEALGYSTIEAGGGAEAVEIYRERGSEIDGVVLDMVMPGMSGRATYLALRELDAEVRVLLVSGYTVNEEVQEILDLGVRGYLPKPHTIDQLAAALGALTTAA